MFTIIIPVRDQEEALLRTLAALAPAAAAGLVADVVVADHGSGNATLEVADAAGCAIVAGCLDRASATRRAVGAARKTWVLGLEAGDLPDDAVLAAVRDHIAGAEGAGSSEPAAVLVRPVGGRALRDALASRAFALGGWSRPERRRVLSPRAQAGCLLDMARRWSGIRLQPRIERTGD